MVIQLKMKPGETIKKIVEITNLRDEEAEFNLNSTFEFVEFEKSFVLQSNESRYVEFIFNVSKNVEPKLYTSSVFVESGNVEKISIILEVIQEYTILELIEEKPKGAVFYFISVVLLVLIIVLVILIGLKKKKPKFQ